MPHRFGNPSKPESELYAVGRLDSLDGVSGGTLALARAGANGLSVNERTMGNTGPFAGGALHMSYCYTFLYILRAAPIRTTSYAKATVYASPALTSNNRPSTNGLTIANSPSKPRTSSRFESFTTNAACEVVSAFLLATGSNRAARRLAPSCRTQGQ